MSQQCPDPEIRRQGRQQGPGEGTPGQGHQAVERAGQEPDQGMGIEVGRDAFEVSKKGPQSRGVDFGEADQSRGRPGPEGQERHQGQKDAGPLQRPGQDQGPAPLEHLTQANPHKGKQHHEQHPVTSENAQEQLRHVETQLDEDRHDQDFRGVHIEAAPRRGWPERIALRLHRPAHARPCQGHERDEACRQGRHRDGRAPRQRVEDRNLQDQQQDGDQPGERGQVKTHPAVRPRPVSLPLPGHLSRAGECPGDQGSQQPGSALHAESNRVWIGQGHGGFGQGQATQHHHGIACRQPRKRRPGPGQQRPSGDRRQDGECAGPT